MLRAFSPLAPFTSLLIVVGAPLFVMLMVPPLVVIVLSAERPRPAAPATLIVIVPSLIVTLVPLIAAVYDGSVLLLVSTFPLAVNVNVPPLIRASPSALRHLPPAAVVGMVMLNVPSSTYRFPEFSSSCPSASAVVVSSDSRSACMPSSPTPLMVTLPLFIWKYLLHEIPSLTAERILSVRFFTLI